MSQLMLVNPSKRRTRRRRKTSAKRKSTTITVRSNPRRRRAVSRRRRTYRMRRNPIGGRFNLMRTIQESVIPAATAAGGALALDVVWGMIPVPETLKTGPLRHVVKGAGAIGLGAVAGMIVSKKTASQFTSGALTVVTYNALREMVTRFAPNIQLGEYSEDELLGYVSTGQTFDYEPDEMGVYPDEGIGVYPSAVEVD